MTATIALYLDLTSGLWIPCVMSWDPDTGEFGRAEGPQGFARYEQAVQAARFLTRNPPDGDR